jgi:hypothetical protein
MAERRDEDMADVARNRSELGDRSGETQGGSGGVQGLPDTSDRTEPTPMANKALTEIRCAPESDD